MGDKLPLRFAAFHGIGAMSQTIKFFTRSEISHIACIDGPSGKLIEAWNHEGGWKTWWDWSDYSKHTPGTKYDVWEILLPADIAIFCQVCYQSMAHRKVPYDWPGVIAFGLRMVRPSKEGMFCSEGAILPVAQCMGWRTNRPDHISPITFCMLMEAIGGRIVQVGVC